MYYFRLELSSSEGQETQFYFKNFVELRVIGMSMQSPINALRSTIEQILSIQIVHFKILLEASKWIFGRREFGNILMYSVPLWKDLSSGCLDANSQGHHITFKVHHA